MAKSFAILLLVWSISETLSCPNVKYVKTAGYRTTADWDVRLVVKDVQECIDVCSNQNVCHIFDYDEKAKLCYFFPKIDYKNRTQTENSSFSQYEKVCFKADNKFSMKCDKPIIRALQKVLIGIANTVTTSTKFTDCVQDCVDSEKLYGFTCVSGMFYSAEEGMNCVLNSETSKSYPEYYYEENLDQVEYFEFDCDFGDVKKLNKRALTDLPKPRHRSVLWPNSADWGSWTRCDNSGGNRFRYRQCKSLNPNSCQKDSGTCDPTNRAQEMQDIMNEEAGGPTGNGNQIQPVTNPNVMTPPPENGMATNGGNVLPPTDGGLVVPGPPTDGGMVQPTPPPMPPPDGGVPSPTVNGGMVQPNPNGGMVPTGTSGNGGVTQPNPNEGMASTGTGNNGGMNNGGMNLPTTSANGRATILIQLSTLPPGPMGNTSMLASGNGPKFIFVENQPPTQSSGNNQKNQQTVGGSSNNAQSPMADNTSHNTKNVNSNGSTKNSSHH